MALVAWAPEGYNAPVELLAVKIKPGKVTEREWREALSDRISALAIKEGEQTTALACRELNVPMVEELYQAGQSLVLHNLVLRQALDLNLIGKNPFPSTVGEPDQEVKDALELSLMDWVDQALSLVSESSLD